MEDLTCPQLLNCLGQPVPTEKIIKNNKVIVFYFSASYSTPCEELLPKLRQLQDAIKKHRRCGIVIIYVSFDTNEETMIKYFKERHHGWYCIPFNSVTIRELQLKYNVSHVPQLIVVKMDGTIVTKKGKSELETHGDNVIIQWSEPDVTRFRNRQLDWLKIMRDTKNPYGDCGRDKQGPL